MMTPDKIAELRGMTGKATARPWNNNGTTGKNRGLAIRCKARQLIGTTGDENGQQAKDGVFRENSMRRLEHRQANTALIVAAVNALPDLLDAAERTAKLEAALQLLYDWQNGCPLPSYEEGWNEAMRLAHELLTDNEVKHEGAD